MTVDPQLNPGLAALEARTERENEARRYALVASLAAATFRPLASTSLTYSGVTYRTYVYEDTPAVIDRANRAGGVNIYRRPERDVVTLIWQSTIG